MTRSSLQLVWHCSALTAALCLGEIRAADADTPPPRDFAAVTKQIDAQIQKRLDEAKIKPSPLTDDAEFLRRVYLDITGRIPSADKAAEFLDSNDPDK